MCGLVLLLTMLQVNEDKEVVLQVLIALRNLIYNRYNKRVTTVEDYRRYQSRLDTHIIHLPVTTVSIIQLLSQREDFISPSQSTSFVLYEENFLQVHLQRR